MNMTLVTEWSSVMGEVLLLDYQLPITDYQPSQMLKDCDLALEMWR